MVDSRAKGRVAETSARDYLRSYTGLKWQRTPLSGALAAHHMLKGDVYVPGTNIKYCVEIKHYKDDHISTKLITSKNPQFDQWWEQTVREAKQMDKEPLLVFKHNRSKWFAAFIDEDVYYSILDSQCKSLVYNPADICICLLEDFCNYAEFKE